ncbi:MAG TPA: MBG domain-containing protein, partial [Alphaproteobacteria bacterium]|nr:MBG domain-containing protein [Alphaproteobacteria bacterium]
NPTLSVVYTGFKNSETQSVIDTLATASTAADVNSNVGTYGISSTGASDINYDFTYANTGVLSVTKATITVDVDDQSRTYGDGNPALTYSYSGFKNGQNSGVFTTQATASTVADALSNAGTYVITAAGAAADNYDFTYQDGTLTVGKAGLTATVTGSGTREYGEANPAFGITYSGFVNGDDDLDIDTLASISAPNATTNVGTYAVTASGALDNNYSFIYVDGSLAITKATLTATADDDTRQQGQANPAFNITYTGFKNGENASVIDTQATASSPADNSSPAGTYAITPLGGVDNNYDFIYVDGVLNVTAAITPPVTPPAPTPVPVTPVSPSVPAAGGILLNPQSSEAIRIVSSSGIFSAQSAGIIMVDGGGSIYENFFTTDNRDAYLNARQYGLVVLPEEDAADVRFRKRYLIGIARALLETP